jgi:sporulation related protein
MPRKKSKSILDEDQPVLQLTSGQMVYAVCALLMGALICVLVGMAIPHLDKSLRDRAAAQTTDPKSEQPAPAPQAPPKSPSSPEPKKTTPVKAQQPKPTATGKATVGKQTSPRDVVMPPPKTAANKEQARKTSTVKKAPLPNKLSTKAHVPSVGGVTGHAPSRRHTASASTEAKAPAVDPKKTPASPAAKASASSVKPPSTPKPGATATAPKKPTQIGTEKPAPKTPAAPVPASTKSTKDYPYAVQVAAFPASQPDKANRHAQELLQKEKVAVELKKSADGKWIQVLVGAYRDQESAKKACNELRKRKIFKDCWVQKR